MVFVTFRLTLNNHYFFEDVDENSILVGYTRITKGYLTRQRQVLALAMYYFADLYVVSCLCSMF